MTTIAAVPWRTRLQRPLGVQPSAAVPPLDGGEHDWVGVDTCTTHGVTPWPCVLVLSVGVPLLVFPRTRGPAQTLCVTHDTVRITERARVQTIRLTEVVALSAVEVSPPARYLEAQYALQLWNAEQRELARITLNAFEPPHLRRMLDALRVTCPWVTIDPHVWHLLTLGDDGGTP